MVKGYDDILTNPSNYGGQFPQTLALPTSSPTLSYNYAPEQLLAIFIFIRQIHQYSRTKILHKAPLLQNIRYCFGTVSNFIRTLILGEISNLFWMKLDAAMFLSDDVTALAKSKVNSICYVNPFLRRRGSNTGKLRAIREIPFSYTLRVHFRFH